MTKNALRPAFSAFLLMLTISLMSTGLSFFVAPVCADLGFGRGSFTLYYSLIVAVGAVSASFLATPVWGMVYDIFGTYLPALIIMPAALAASVVCLQGAFKK